MNAILKYKLPDESDWLHGCQMILALHMLMLFCINLVPITLTKTFLM